MINFAPTLQEVFQYNPFDNNFNTGDLKIKLDDFYKDFFVKSHEYQEGLNALLKAVNPKSNDYRKFNFLTSYSGNGKTTFIHWFKMESEKSSYWTHIMNLSKENLGIIDDEVINKVGNKELASIIGDSDLLELIITSKSPLEEFEYLSESNRAEIIKIYNNTTLLQILNFLEGLDFGKKLILYILTHILRNNKNKKILAKKAYIFCFDNLDNLPFEYLSNKLWLEVKKASDAVRGTINSLNKRNYFQQPFDYSRRVAFIITLREHNGFFPKSNGQEADNSVNTLRLISGINAEKIVSKRIDYARKYCEKEEPNKDILDLIELLFRDNKLVPEILMPLFNFDYRKILKMLLNITNESFSKYGKLLNIGIEELNAMSEDNKIGLRGAILNSVIKHYILECFFTNLSKRNVENYTHGHCSNRRMMLTVFSNLSYPKGFRQNSPQELFNQAPEQFNLIQAWNSCNAFILDLNDINKSIDNFFKILAALVEFKEDSWAHLITIYGKKPELNGTNYSYNFSKEKDLLKIYLSKNYVSNQIKELYDITITLNASGYAYLRWVLTHFEYISTYKSRNGDDFTNPLFSTLKIINNKWAFESVLNDVYQTTKQMSENTWNYFEHHLKQNKKVTEHEFLKGDLAFKGDEAGKSLFYITRLITTIIDYVEKFRQFANSNEGRKRIVHEIESNNETSVNNELSLKSIEKVILHLTQIVSKFIGLLEKRDFTITSIKEKLEEKALDAHNNPYVKIQTD